MTFNEQFFESADQNTAANKTTIDVLTAFRAHGINKPVLTGDLRVEGLTPDQVASSVEAIKRSGLLKDASVQRGHFSVTGSQLSLKGDETLRTAESADILAADKAEVTRILGDALKADGPYLSDPGNTQEDRHKELIASLKDKGLLKRASVTRGSFSIEGVQITPEGKEAARVALSRVEPRPDDICIG